MPASARRYDAVVIGGGHNGLTCAAYLAGGGLSVCVLERRAVLGGAAVTEEFHPGFRNSTASYTVSLLHPKVIRDLKLAQHGLAIVERPFANFLPLPEEAGGGYLKVGGGLAATQAEVAKYLRARCRAAARVLRDARSRRRRAARPAARDAAQLGGGLPAMLDAWKVAKRFRALDLAGQRDVLDLFTKSAGDVLDRWFESAPIKAAFGFDAVVGNLREPVRAGVGVRAAAPRLRRGQRQAGAVGPCAGRHGRDHRSDGEGMRRARRRAAHRRGCRAGPGRTADERLGVVLASGEKVARGARGRQRQSALAVRAARRARAAAGRFSRAHRRIPLRLRNVPDERRAVRACPISPSLAGYASRSRTTRAASSSRRRSPTWSARTSMRARGAGRRRRSSRC